MLRMLDLFAGIGGFSYAGEKLVGGYETVAFCEYDEHAQKVLRKHWPDTEIIKDIRGLANDADRFRGMVDIITGGYPCQPFSLAGVRRGDQDDRHLWPEMLRVIQAVRPRWVIGENVAGHITMGLDTALSDLESCGFSCRCYIIPAVAADAPHRRDRCWIVAHAGGGRHRVEEEKIFAGGDGTFPSSARARDVADRRSEGIGKRPEKFWLPEPGLGRVAYGIPDRVHRVNRLKQLGNSIVPQVAARILYAIKEADNASEVRD